MINDLELSGQFNNQYYQKEIEMEIKNLDYHEDRWLEGNWNPQELIEFIHLSGGVNA